MNCKISEKEKLFYRSLLALVFIVMAASLRIAPHPWNFAPIGAMALFSGALVRDRRLAFLFPLVTLFAGDLLIGFYKITAVVYVSFLLSVLIGRWLQNHRSVTRIAGVTLLGAAQFFIVTNFGVWTIGNFYPRTLAGLGACYMAGIPFFWNTLAGDAFYAAVLFGAFALAERLFPVLRQAALEKL